MHRQLFRESGLFLQEIDARMALAGIHGDRHPPGVAAQNLLDEALVASKPAGSFSQTAK